MTPLRSNRDVINSAMAAFQQFLNQQVFSPQFVIPMEAMKIIVRDWIEFYISYFAPQLRGDRQERERAQEELWETLQALARSFLAKYGDFLNAQ
ncbi:alpha-hemoglobin-stabilizing protein-like [Tachyglossus aculeatus]|uniref:alpha-hemoglobin-stabilizing protein-like n=1 Tax=Tachyglossus aculeatus TaxID=9261 RepID=UPI0018F7C398|nr:alpha-hemoglobin-stabilizing protein-like [Tachyglossus aculeatus]